MRDGRRQREPHPREFYNGQRFGKLTIIAPTALRLKCEAQCDCGNKVVVTYANILRGASKSCGCLNDKTGKRYGKLLVLHRAAKEGAATEVMWAVRCDCGKEFDVLGGSLTSGNTRSCGCLRKKVVARAPVKSRYLVPKDGTHKVCSVCKLDKPAAAFNKNGERLRSECKECRVLEEKRYTAVAEAVDARLHWAKRVVSGIKLRCLKSGLKFEITAEFLREIAGDVCAYCACPLKFNKPNTQAYMNNSASVDQIAPRAGYTAANVAVVCFRCNMVKRDATPQELEVIAAGIRRVTAERATG